MNREKPLFILAINYMYLDSNEKVILIENK